MDDLVDAIGLPLLAEARDLLGERRARGVRREQLAHVEGETPPHEPFDARSVSTHAAGKYPHGIAKRAPSSSSSGVNAWSGSDT